MQKITVQQDKERETRSARETTREAKETIHDSVFTPPARTSQHQCKALPVQKEATRADKIMVTLALVFFVFGIAWLFMNTSFQFDNVYKEGMTLKAGRDMLLFFVVEFMAIASARTAATAIDRWLTQRSEQNKIN